MSPVVTTLGIETSCDETAVSIIRGNRTLAETIASSVRRHKRYGGVVPEIASRAHLESLLPCLHEALHEARLTLNRIDLIAATGGPGLMGSLLVGVSCAKSLALVLNKPLVFVDHVLAHAFSGQWSRKKIEFPFIGLVVSGGHTLLIHWKTIDKVEVIGSTTDDAAGEAFDKVASMLGLGYPGGPELEKLARKALVKQKEDFGFPRPMMRDANYDFSFSGLKTSVYYRLRDIKKVSPSQKVQIAREFQEAVCDVLIHKSLKACKAFDAKLLVIGGGVSANGRLRQRFDEAKPPGLDIVFPQAALSVDNATMIAFLGAAQAEGHFLSLKSPAGRRKALAFSAYSGFGR